MYLLIILRIHMVWGGFVKLKLTPLATTLTPLIAFIYQMYVLQIFFPFSKLFVHLINCFLAIKMRHLIIKIIHQINNLNNVNKGTVQLGNWQKIWLDILQKEMTKLYDKKCSEHESKYHGEIIFHSSLNCYYQILTLIKSRTNCKQWNLIHSWGEISTDNM